MRAAAWIGALGVACGGAGGEAALRLGLVDGDGDGAAALAEGGADCDDADPARHPAATEVCNGQDDDCDGWVDDQDPSLDRRTAARVHLQDRDGDGYAGGPPSWTCRPPAGLPPSGDCDEARADRHPGAIERCDGADNDCDGLTDEEDPGVVGLQPLWPDGDLDGFGVPPAQEGCAARPGLAAQPGDCEDGDGRRAPGLQDACRDGLDQDCDGVEPNPWLIDLGAGEVALPEAAEQLDLWVRRVGALAIRERLVLASDGERPLELVTPPQGERLCWPGDAPSCCSEVRPWFPDDAFVSLTLRWTASTLEVLVGGVLAVACAHEGAPPPSWRLGDSGGPTGVIGFSQLATWRALQPVAPLPSLLLPTEQSGLWRVEGEPGGLVLPLRGAAPLVVDPLAWQEAPCP
jgi:hypothetical protein